ncbi:hypothetical protein COV24_01005 [candidate division WWE3 bacterium CG10_big_fil_rev_8_21_14_0_10_32_10]|uniref:Glycosyltransferase RgtA/B/C/D-like domain-containing protein n=1 Tax=candidate division WWE3 bacterium CG10_big_fil_rev_8_21_14_0_10_32_10 TaxID=1975090 RepID=A0A2H0RBE1_UNCKA|nr:MAG: hypothetical protein COV24_01005 [candidate division WWE3 bacterium CG10_big_fil_rev_8_21_14_0_10_32_10]
MKKEKLKKLIYLFSVVLSICAWYSFKVQNLILSYNDARSHLNIARRVVDGLNPGIAQLGSVWLPLPHILELLTIWNNFFYRTGLSGSIISMLSFVGTIYFLVKIGELLRFDFKGIIITVLVFAFNPNVLYMQSIPMTELLLIYTQIGSIYFFIKWVKKDRILSLIFLGIYTFLSVLTRYDGWFTFFYISFAIILITIIKKYKVQPEKIKKSVSTILSPEIYLKIDKIFLEFFKKLYTYKIDINFNLKDYLKNTLYKRVRAESNFILYSVWGFFAIFLWLLWNWLIFYDPLFFLNGAFSAKSQQEILYSEGRLLTKGSIDLAAITYVVAVVKNSGLLVFLFGFLGIIKIFFKRRSITFILSFLALLSPLVFNIFSLYLGHSVIHLPSIPPYTWFNIRYGLIFIPTIALGCGILVSKKEFLFILILAITTMQYTYMYIKKDIVTIEDATKGASGYYLDDIGTWANKNANDGLILVAASSHDSFIFVSGLSLNHFITEGTGRYWKKSLIDPTIYATYIVMHDGDLVDKALKHNFIFAQNYHLVYKGNFANIYKINRPITINIPK